MKVLDEGKGFVQLDDKQVTKIGQEEYVYVSVAYQKHFEYVKQKLKKDHRDEYNKYYNQNGNPKTNVPQMLGFSIELNDAEKQLYSELKQKYSSSGESIGSDQ